MPRTDVAGTFYRHARVGLRELTGSNGGGRWGPPGGFEVLYLGRPEHSIVIEAHRHLVEASEGMRPELVGPRDLIMVEVDVTNVVDLRTAEAQRAVDLSTEVLHSAARDPEAYAECQQLGRAAHQLEAHGILAPAAGGLGGETLALFPAHLPINEHPSVLGVRTWASLPPDPRRMRLAEGTQSG